VWNARWDIKRNVESRQHNFNETANAETPGERLLIAFQESLNLKDKQKIAEILGFQTDKAVYKVASGKGELSFEALIKYRNSTKRSIDWLLTGEGQKDIRDVDEYSIEDLLPLLLTQLNVLPAADRHWMSLTIIHALTENAASFHQQSKAEESIEVALLKDIRPTERLREQGGAKSEQRKTRK